MRDFGSLVLARAPRRDEEGIVVDPNRTACERGAAHRPAPPAPSVVYIHDTPAPAPGRGLQTNAAVELFAEAAGFALERLLRDAS